MVADTLPPRPSRSRRRQAPPLRVVPPEVAMAEAFIHMTGLDPTSIYSHQSPPPRQSPPSFGPAGENPAPPKPSLWARARKAVQSAVRSAASWLYHRTLRACLGGTA